MALRARWLFAAMFAACAALIGFALFLQHGRGLEPCPMCILQRYAFVGIGVVALVAALHDPWTVGRRIYGLLALLAIAGGGVAIRHVYLEHYPPQIFDCGADLGYMLESFTLSDMLPMIFRGTGDCTKVPWRFLGLSIAEWSLIWFAILLAAALAAIFLRARR
jgi:disulfide bond formation protein DsbB